MQRVTGTALLVAGGLGVVLLGGSCTGEEDLPAGHREAGARGVMAGFHYYDLSQGDLVRLLGEQRNELATLTYRRGLGPRDMEATLSRPGHAAIEVIAIGDRLVAVRGPDRAELTRIEDGTGLTGSDDEMEAFRELEADVTTLTLVMDDLGFYQMPVYPVEGEALAELLGHLPADEGACDAKAKPSGAGIGDTGGIEPGGGGDSVVYEQWTCYNCDPYTCEWYYPGWTSPNGQGNCAADPYGPQYITCASCCWTPWGCGCNGGNWYFVYDYRCWCYRWVFVGNCYAVCGGQVRYTSSCPY